MRISLIVLAAGKSSRTGALGKKPLLPWPIGPGSLLGQVLKNYKNAHNWHDAVVVHRDDSPIYAKIVKDASKPFRSIENTNPQALMSESLRLGIDALSQATDGALVALGDMPFITKTEIQQILAPAQTDKIVQPKLSNRPANPVFFPASTFTKLKKAQGDQGGRDVIKSHTGQLIRLEFTDPQPFRDIDTAKDYSAAVKELTQH